MSFLIVPLVFIAVFALGAFFWFWWAAPRAQVQLHFDADQLKQLEVQDRLRQTSYQVLTGLGLVATFVAGAVQLWISSNQWNADYRLRLQHEQDQQFAEATKSLVEAAGRPYAQIAAQRIAGMVSESADVLGPRAITVLESVVRDRSRDNQMRESRTCTIDTGDPGQKWPFHELREEPQPAAQAAIQQLGSGPLAALRHSFTGRACDGAGRRLDFANRSFDNFDLSGLDLSCSIMPQAKLRRVSLRNANLFGADLRGARLADYDVPNSPANTGKFVEEAFTTESIGFDPDRETKQKPLVKGSPRRLEVWQTYRCFITDLRDADLRGVDFENAALGGADFRGADLTGANLCGATVSRANFTGAKGLTRSMLQEVCVGRPEDLDGAIDASQPLGLAEYFSVDFKKIKQCDGHKCGPRDAQRSDALINRPRR